MDASNHVGQAPQVEVKAISIDAAASARLIAGTFSAAPISINIYRFYVQAAE